MKSLVAVAHLFWDGLLYLTPKPRTNYGFAFIIHPRDSNDVYRKYPLFRYFPQTFVEWFTFSIWPITVSKVTGLRNVRGEAVPGYVIAIPLTARQMLEHRSRAVKKVRAAVNLGRAYGLKYFGLGGLVSSVTKGGLDLLDIPDVCITTGHAYTGYNVTRNVLEFVQLWHRDPAKTVVAIVGAAGSIGSTSAQILARAGFKKILLIDLERKKELVHALVPELEKLQPTIDVVVTHQVAAVKEADFVVAATNAPEALIHADDLKPGAVVVDDAQPSDVADDVFERSDVLAVEAGVVHTPGITANFNMGLKDREDNFCCMAELLILAARRFDGHYVINRATLAHVDEVARWGDELGFTLAQFQNRRALISQRQVDAVGTIGMTA